MKTRLTLITLELRGFLPGTLIAIQTIPFVMRV